MFKILYQTQFFKVYLLLKILYRTQHKKYIFPVKPSFPACIKHVEASLRRENIYDSR